MKWGFYLFFITSFLASFFILNNVYSANSDIVINEIGAYEPSGFEWVEIYNKGTESIDMTGWKFWENNTNHGLSVGDLADMNIEVGEYAVVVQNIDNFLSKYPDFIGTVIDSSWGSLKESGEEIGIKDSEGNFIENFTYISAPNFSLERKDFNLNDYSENNWQENLTKNSVGFVNSNFGTAEKDSTVSTEIINTTTNASSQEIISLPESVYLEDDLNNTKEQVKPVEDLSKWNKIKINEFSSYPVGVNEWVELYNTGDQEFDLEGGLICDSRETRSTCKTISGKILPKNWLVLDLNTTRFLNNNGDSVILKTPSEVLVDKIIYDDLNIEVPKKGMSAMRKIDGEGGNNFLDWVVGIPTPGVKNFYTQNIKEEYIEINLPQNKKIENIKTEEGSTSKLSQVLSKEIIKPFDVSKFSEIVSASEDQVVEEKEIVKTKNIKKTTSSKKIIYSGEITKARNLKKGQWVSVKGFVSVLPSVFGTQYFYIMDSKNGIQIYQSKKDFPDLDVGDEVQITGYASEARGFKKINVKNKYGIKILSKKNDIYPEEFEIEELNEENLGLLVEISGDITEIKSKYMYVDNDKEEIVVYFKKGAKIDKEKFKEGEKVEITGVLEKTDDGLQIWTRNQEDIKVIGLSDEYLKTQTVEKNKNSNEYLKTTLVGFFALIAGFVIKAKSSFLVGVGKKVVVVISKIFTKN